MPKTFAFCWDEKLYHVEKLLLPNAEEFFALQERMSSDDVKTSDKYGAAMKLLAMMRCPPEVLAGAAIDELEDLLVTLQLGHFGKQKGGGGESPPVAGAP